MLFLHIQGSNILFLSKLFQRIEKNWISPNSLLRLVVWGWSFEKIWVGQHGHSRQWRRKVVPRADQQCPAFWNSSIAFWNSSIAKKNKEGRSGNEKAKKKKKTWQGQYPGWQYLKTNVKSKPIICKMDNTSWPRVIPEMHDCLNVKNTSWNSSY